MGSGARARDALDLWPGAVHRMVALLHAGAGPLAVWRALGSWAEEAQAGGSRDAWSAAPGRDLKKALDRAGAAAGAGGDPLAALRTASLEHPRSREARDILAAAWRVSGATGAPLAGVLTRVAGGLEDALDAADAREAAIAGPRSTGRLLAALPFLGLGLGVLMGTDPLGTLLGTGWGRVVLAIGSALSVAGVAWSRRLIRVAEGGEA
jgi:tight adherence protein B